MADEFDRASDLEQMDRDMCIGAARQAAQKSTAGTGVCLWCEAPLPIERRWCGPDCRDLHELALGGRI